MDPEQLRFIVLATASKALAEQVVRNQLTEQALRRKFGELAGQVAAVSTASEPARTTQVKTFAAIEIHDTIQCNEPLDAVKCLPEFAGTQESYVSWRQAAVAAYHIFRRFDGSSRS